LAIWGETHLPPLDLANWATHHLNTHIDPNPHYLYHHHPLFVCTGHIEQVHPRRLKPPPLFVLCIPASTTQVTILIAPPTLSSHPPGSFCSPPSNVIAALGICFCRSEKGCPTCLLGSHLPRFRYIAYSYPDTPHTTPCAALPPRNTLYFTINTVVLNILD
jgi:hypothetical protein